MTLLSKLHLLKRRIFDPFYPRVVTATVRSEPAVFEVTNSAEEYRAKKLGNERDVLERFLDEIKERDVLWDVGANVGVFTIFAARAGADVVSFEPDPGFRQRLERNVNLNGQSSHVRIDSRALSDQATSTTLYTDGVDGPSPSLSGADETRDQVTVTSVLGDDIDQPAPDILKIDVEGAEMNVLTGMSSQLDDVRCVLLEIHPEMIENFGFQPGDPADCLREAGFIEEWSTIRDTQEILLFCRD
jgi:FkbM family methyltransferase